MQFTYVISSLVEHPLALQFPRKLNKNWYYQNFVNLNVCILNTTVYWFPINQQPKCELLFLILAVNNNVVYDLFLPELSFCFCQCCKFISGHGVDLFLSMVSFVSANLVFINGCQFFSATGINFVLPAMSILSLKSICFCLR